MPDFLNLHRIHIEQDHPIGDETDEASEITSFWRSAGVAAAILFFVLLAMGA